MKRMMMSGLLLLLLLVVLAACLGTEETVSGSDGDDPDGDDPDGDDPDGDDPDGDEPDGPCEKNFDCIPSQYCDFCAASSCANCDDCLALCVDHGCGTETENTCGRPRSDCVAGQVSVIRDGCWVCVDRESCAFVRDARCDDGLPLQCNSPTPECAADEILAHQQGCYVCVNPDNCDPWKETECESDRDCSAAYYCEECSMSSCPDCEDCIAGCWPHLCETEYELLCDMERPACGDEGASVIRDGCWICVNRDSCEPINGEHDPSCDDGSEPLCDMVEPVCDGHEILAYRNSCYLCVNPATCEPWGVPNCAGDTDCPVDQWCNGCGSSSCPICADCVAACVPHGCETQPEATCDMARPDCGASGVAVIRDGCWICVNRSTCQPTGGHDPSCDDGAPVTCNSPAPECGTYEILAYQDGCHVCVNPATCKPWGQAGCEHQADCPVEDYCDPCGTAPCPDCDACLPACMPHGCQTEAVATCKMMRPDCGLGKAAVVKDGCWVCVTLGSCSPTRDEHCDDGTDPICNMVEPTCGEHEILAYQDNCYVCVNPLTCKPWGESGCTHDYDCDAALACDGCATSSCPLCGDCVAACVPHGCPTEPVPACYMMRPDCDAGQVAVVQDLCWVCVDDQTCQ